MGKSKKDPAFEEVFKMAVKLGISPKELEYSINKLSNAGISSAKACEELMKIMNNHRRESMKRELILDKVNYDGEYYSTKILKQTHRGKEFTPTGTEYDHCGFCLKSSVCPVVGYERLLFVRGSRASGDNEIIKTKDKSVIDKALAAVKAYNEEFGCDENLETARSNFIEAERDTLGDISDMLASMQDCSREEFMEFKKQIYTEHADLNIDGDSCVYCIDNRCSYGANCTNCDYGKKNGACNDVGSVYKEIETARNELADALENY